MNFKLKRKAGRSTNLFEVGVHDVYKNYEDNGYDYYIYSKSGGAYYFNLLDGEIDNRGSYLDSNNWEVVKLRRKRKMDQFKVGETYLCTRATSLFTEGKLYEVLDGGYESQPFIVSDSGETWFTSDFDDIYSQFEKVEEPKPKEITLTIKGKTFYDIRSEAEELLNLVNSIIEASEELGISEEKVKRIYGGAK